MIDVDIYTDGGCSGNPGPGGWAFVVLWEGNRETGSGGVPNTTNNRMELSAVIEALGFILLRSDMKKSAITLYTDSVYVKNGITAWIHRWITNGWITAAKKPVKNRDLWMKLNGLTENVNVTWQWVKAHAGNEMNELCDTMVRAEIRNKSGS